MKKYLLLFILGICTNSVAQQNYVIDPNFKSQELFNNSSGAFFVSTHIDNSILLKFPSYVKGLSSQSSICRVKSNGDLDTTFFAEVRDLNSLGFSRDNSEVISYFRDGKILISGNPKPIKVNGESADVILLDKNGKFLKSSDILKKNIKTFTTKSNTTFFIAPVMPANFYDIFSSSNYGSVLKLNTEKLRKFDTNFVEDLNFKFEGLYQYYNKVIELQDGKLLVVAVEGASGGFYENAKINFVVERYLSDGRKDNAFKKIQFTKNNRNNSIREIFQIVYDENLKKLFYFETPTRFDTGIQISEINDDGSINSLFYVSEQNDIRGIIIAKYAKNYFYFFYDEGVIKTDINGNLITYNKFYNDGKYSLRLQDNGYIVHDNEEITVFDGEYQFEAKDSKNKEFWRQFRLDRNLLVDRSYKSQQLRFVDLTLKTNKKEEVYLSSDPKRIFFVKENKLKTDQSDFVKFSIKGDLDTLSFPYIAQSNVTDGSGNPIYTNPIDLYASNVDNNGRLFVLEKKYVPDGVNSGYIYYLSLIDEKGLKKSIFINLNEKIQISKKANFRILDSNSENIFVSVLDNAVTNSLNKIFKINIETSTIEEVVLRNQAKQVIIHRTDRDINFYQTPNGNFMLFTYFDAFDDGNNYTGFENTVFDKNGSFLKNTSNLNNFYSMRYTGSMDLSRKAEYIELTAAFRGYRNGVKLFDKYPNKRYINFNGDLFTPSEEKYDLNVKGYKMENIKVLRKNTDDTFFVLLNGYRFAKLIKTKSERQTINFETITNKTASDREIILKASSSSQLPVNFVVVSGPASIYTGNTLTLDGASGTVVVKAIQTGNEIFALVEVTQTFEVSKLLQEIQNTFIPDKFFESPSFNYQGKSTSNLPLDISVISGPAIVYGNKITLTKQVGEVKMKISQNGNYQYLPAKDIFLSFNVTNILSNEPTFSNFDDTIIYPNPSTGEFKIKLDLTKFSKKLLFDLFDLNGNKIEIKSTFNYNENEIGFYAENLANGSYYLQLMDKQETKGYKILIFK